MVIIGILIVAIGVFLYLLYRLGKPKPGVDCHKQTDWKWSQNCMYIEEVKPAPQGYFKSPKNLRLSLIDFSYSPSGGPAFSQPTWYRFRYVNVKTGEYSDFSDWTKSPVQAGSPNLPCENKCIQGKETCTFNRPVIGIKPDNSFYNPNQNVVIDNIPTMIYINIHRWVNPDVSDTKPPLPDVKDEIVGLVMPSSIKGEKYLSFTDIGNNPCLKVRCLLNPSC